MRHSVAPKGATMNRLAPLVAVALAGSVLAVLAGVSLTESAATTPGRNGRIVYAQEVEGHFQLFTIRPNGTGRARVGHVTGDAVHPDWSPDGTKIVFELDHPQGDAGLLGGNHERGRQRLDRSHRDADRLRGSAGVHARRAGIVFMRFDDAADVESIQSMDLTGGDRRLVTGTKGSGRTDPTCRRTATGSRSSESRRRTSCRQSSRSTPTAPGCTRLTPFKWEVAIKHDWSPNGRRIVLTTNADWVRPHKSANLVTIRPDGSGLKRLTRFAGGSTRRMPSRVPTRPTGGESSSGSRSTTRPPWPHRPRRAPPAPADQVQQQQAAVHRLGHGPIEHTMGAAGSGNAQLANKNAQSERGLHV